MGAKIYPTLPKMAPLFDFKKEIPTNFLNNCEKPKIKHQTPTIQLSGYLLTKLYFLIICYYFYNILLLITYYTFFYHTYFIKG